MSKSTVQAAAKATTGTTPADKPKGARPSHRLTRVVEANGTKQYQDVGALWPHKDGKGFSLRLKAAANPGDNLLIRTTQFGGAS